MALTIIWVLFFIVAFIVAIYRAVIFHEWDIFKTLVDGMFDSAKSSVLDVAFPLAGNMIFFLGLMKIAEHAGAIQKLAKWINPFMKRLFPSIPNHHPAMGEMVLNFSANMLGLDSASTPFGLKAMESLQTLNPQKDTATNAQIMFLVIHTSGPTLIPLSIITYRMALGSINPTSVFIPCILGTVTTVIVSIIIVSFWQKLQWDIILVSWLMSIVIIVTGIAWGMYSLSAEHKLIVGKTVGNAFLFFIVVVIICGGLWKRVNVFQSFIEGASHGFTIIFKIIPYLVGMLVAIRVFRDCGALDYMEHGIGKLLQIFGVGQEVVPALPTALMKPFSGAAARGLMIDTMKTYSPDSFTGQLACIFQGSADTTLYIIALYFGSVGIRKIRYAIWAGMITDFIGVMIAIFLAYIFFR